MADETEKKSSRRGVVFLLVVIALLVLAMIYRHGIMIHGTGITRCAVNTRDPVVAPDKKHQAVVYDMDCSGGVGKFTQISISPTDVSFLPSTYPAFFNMAGAADVMVQWTGDRRLDVTVPEGKVVQKDAVGPDGIIITYH